MASTRRRRFWNYPRRGKGIVQRWLPSWRVVVGSILTCMALGAGLFFAAWTSTAIPDNLDDVDHQATTVYYANGKEIGTYSSVKRELVAYEDLPPYVGNAVVASENATFWDDPGVDVKGLARAAWNNLTSSGSRQGGSTLTQQYVERYYLGTTTDLVGKAREAIIALKIGRSEPKELVLERYLNTIYFGRGAYGIQAAAQEYFGKNAADLTYSEAAMLSGIIPAPVSYDPSVNEDTAKQRWERSIDRMAEQGYITQAEASDATFPEYVPKDESGNSLGGQKGYIMEAVRKELLDSGEFTAEELESRGLQIHTTIKPKLQNKAAKIVESMPEDTNKNIRPSIVSINPADGAIWTLYGGPDFLEQSLNTATDDVVQAGSTFKPFTLIGALEEGHELTEKFDGDSPGQYENDAGDPWPNNFAHVDYGEVDLVEATANSINTAYVELNTEVGPEKTIDVAHRLGIREDESNPIKSYQSNVLGTASVRPVDLASAYATIASGGSYVTPHVVDSVEHMDGTMRYKPDTGSVKEFETDVMNAATYAMTKVVEEGSGSAALDLTGPDGTRRPVAGKTGTANSNQTAWFAGFTPQLATVVNVRQYENVDLEAGQLAGTTEIEAFGPYSEITGSTWPAAAWTEYMQVALEGKDVVEFPSYTPPRPSPSPTPTPTATESEPEWVELPGNIVGMDVARATSLLEGMGLTISTQARDDDSAKGTVVEVSNSGERIPQGSTVTLWVSTGQTQEAQTVAVPGVTGSARAAAEQQLRRVGLQVSVREEYSDQPVGEVIATDPGAGSEVESGATVTIVVSRGPEQTQEPTQEPTSTPSPTEDEGDDGEGPGNGNGNGG